MFRSPENKVLVTLNARNENDQQLFCKDLADSIAEVSEKKIKKSNKEFHFIFNFFLLIQTNEVDIILNSKSKGFEPVKREQSNNKPSASYVKNANTAGNASSGGARYSNGRGNAHNNAADAMQKEETTTAIMTIKKSSSMTNSSLSINNAKSDNFHPAGVKRVNSQLDMNNLVDQRKLNGSVLSLGN